MPIEMASAASRGTKLRDRLTTQRGLYDPVRLYWKGRQALPTVIPKSAPKEVREMARLSRVNVVEIVVTSLVQSLIVEGIRATGQDEDNQPVDETVEPIWRVWRANKMAKRQAGITAAAVAYGVGFAVGVPGQSDSEDDPSFVIRGKSPRHLLASYEDGPDWPTEALESLGAGRYIYYDDEAIYPLRAGSEVLVPAAEEPQPHGLGVTPVVRYEAEDDLDSEDEPPADNPVGHGHRLPIEITTGQIAPLSEIQDQVDITTFGLMVAQHYSAFRQRWVMGWTDATERKAMEFAASVIWAWKDHPDDMRVGEFAETSLDGYIASREHALKYGATLSQTPVHEMTGQLINMAADALAAAEAGRDRKVGLMQTSLGEGHEQLADLIATGVGTDLPDDLQMVWKDTSARAFSVVVQGLGMLANQLGVPVQELWDRVPGFTRQDVRRMKSQAQSGDSMQQLSDMLDRQARNSGDQGGDDAGGQNGGSSLILPANAR